MVTTVQARVSEWEADLGAALLGVYPERHAEISARLVERATAAAADRSAELRALDDRRSANPTWYASRQRVGYMAYVDRFGGDLQGVRGRIPYLEELGVDTLHLLSLLQPRDGENDGGYAIKDYLSPDARVGNSADLDALIESLREHDISLCLDFVLNHTSDDHAWAVAAANGSAYHQALYRMYPDRTQPDAWESTLPEVFPTMAPGNFTWNEAMQQWVWTTFREFQWDLDWSNPDVMVEVCDIALGLANMGVEILRLDAIAFTWKRLGTNCQNQPEAHLIAQALRAVLAIAAPATVLLAEAIVGPADLAGYLGRHELERRECELAYHNQLMVQGWSMLATRRADLARRAIGQLPATPARATWFTYVRCHDDIGWAIDDADAAAVGLSGPEHRAFLAGYFRGDFWGSFARGTAFGTNPETNDERTCGMASTLTGVAAALEIGDPVALEQGIERMLLLYGIAFGFGGIPIIYMGDELCQGDDRAWADDPEHTTDSRWAHRPVFDDDLATRRLDPATPTGRLWDGLQHLIAARSMCGPLDDDGATVELFDPGTASVFGWYRSHPRCGQMIGLANVGDDAVRVTDHPAIAAAAIDVLAPDDADVWHLAPRQVRWITADSSYAPMPAPST